MQPPFAKPLCSVNGPSRHSPPVCANAPGPTGIDKCPVAQYPDPGCSPGGLSGGISWGSACVVPSGAGTNRRDSTWARHAKLGPVCPDRMGYGMYAPQQPPRASATAIWRPHAAGSPDSPTLRMGPAHIPLLARSVPWLTGQVRIQTGMRAVAELVLPLVPIDILTVPSARCRLAVGVFLRHSRRPPGGRALHTSCRQRRGNEPEHGIGERGESGSGMVRNLRAISLVALGGGQPWARTSQRPAATLARRPIT